MNEDFERKLKLISYYLRKIGDENKVDLILSALKSEFKKYSDEAKRFLESEFDSLMRADNLIDIGNDDDSIIESVNDAIKNSILKKID